LRLYFKWLVGILAVVVSALSAAREPAPILSTPVQDRFFERLSSYCGMAFRGEMISQDMADADFATQELIMHVSECSNTEIRIPFFVGDDHSRTWVITKTGSGLQLKHDHRHEDGTSDALTMYGGMTTGEGSSEAQHFPADLPTQLMFDREGIPQSKPNVWTVRVTDTHFQYELNRPGRHFAVSFSVDQLVESPPTPW